MTPESAVQLTVYVVALMLAVKPLGAYMARVFQGEKTLLDPLFSRVEQFIYRCAGIRPGEEMDWKGNARAMLMFNFVGFVVVYAAQRLQGILPLNPEGLPGVPPGPAFNAAISFVTNTNWQAYTGERTMSYVTQMAALAVQNFLSAATGMAMCSLIIRGFSRHTTRTLGNFWVDMTRSTLYILLPLSVILALLLVSQGVIQNFAPYIVASPLESTGNTGTKKESPQHATSGTEGNESSDLQPGGSRGTHEKFPQRSTGYADGKGAEPAPSTGGTAQHGAPTQVLPMGPAASQIAIKQLGTNGGGFFGANSAHPYENPTPLSNWLEMVAILLIPASLCYTFGRMVNDTRQGWALVAVMMLIFIVAAGTSILSESEGNPLLTAVGVDQKMGDLQPGGNMEGKEVRFGIAGSALWATATTAASNGSVNSMHASFTPIGATMQLAMMQLGEVVFGGVGSGLYGMLMFVVVAVFVAGLLVGRTPEYLGHKLEAYEMKMASLVILLMPVTVLFLTALAVVLNAGTEPILNPGPRGFTEVLYAFTSMGNNNGSAFAGLRADTLFYTLSGGVAMVIGRYWLAIPALALAGSLAGKKKIPASAGTLPTHAPLFVAWLIGIVIIVGALSFLPALALGPIVEQLMLPG